MLAAVTAIDALTWCIIVVKATAYGLALVSTGSVTALVFISGWGPDTRAYLARMAVVAAAGAAVFAVLRIPLQAGYLMGGSIDGAFDPFLLKIVAEGPLGASAAVRLVGLTLIALVLLPGKSAKFGALSGGVLVAVSFAMRGHTLSEPRLLLGALIALHFMAAAFWIGALAPLAREARVRDGTGAGAVAREFGHKAVFVVALLFVAGASMLALFGVVTINAMSMDYTKAMAIKLGLFCGVLLMAALNKLSVTPELMSGAPGAARRLRFVIRIEAALIVAVLLVTSLLTTLFSPP